jgi:NAD(P)-dependent dehydrogenase (short-subunit alcohol dehydrogenase family)
MKTAITGHTRGIGAGLYQHLSPNVIGFSRSTGYDINSETDRARIVFDSKDCDIFINNAHSCFGQSLLLIDLFREWKHLDKTIINIGSRVTERRMPERRHDLLNYQAEKLALKHMTESLQGWRCKVVYKWFGYVGTEAILNKYPDFTPSDYITVDQAVKIILL